jgi:hypothetical protein
MKTTEIFSGIAVCVALLCGCDQSAWKDVEDGEFPVEIIPVPCNGLQADTAIEIRDFPTKLYFSILRKEVGPGCWEPDAGITVLAGSPVSYCGTGSVDSLFNFLGIYLGYRDMEATNGIDMKICNFPGEAQLWNRKNLYAGNRCNMWEGEVDIILSGIIYANYYEGMTVAGQLELTSLRKIKTRTK